MSQIIVADSPARRLQPVRPLAAPALPSVRLAPSDSTDRAELERCIANGFARQYGARLEHFLPLLLTLDLEGRPGAIAGLRCAGAARLFLEQYLAMPVEQAVSRCFGQPVDRSQIVEIGNLVALVPGAGSALFALLPRLLERAGVRWVTCTATRQVRAMLGKFGFPIRTICEADPARLVAGAGDWGSYYDARPTVIAGDVRDAARRVRFNRDVRRLQRRLDGELSALAARLRAAR